MPRRQTLRALAEQRLEQSPDRGHADREIVERALVVRALAELDRRGVGAGAEHEALHARVGVVALRHDERPALLDPAGRDRLERFLERPPGGQPEIDRERVGLAARHDDQRRPALAEIARAAGQHVAHRAVAAGDHDVVDPALGEAGEDVLQLAALLGVSTSRLARPLHSGSAAAWRWLRRLRITPTSGTWRTGAAAAPRGRRAG